jgi:hypothetical protein
LLSGVMDVFSVIRRTPHEFKIACLQVSVALCNGAWSHKTQWWTEIPLMFELIHWACSWWDQ